MHYVCHSRYYYHLNRLRESPDGTRRMYLRCIYYGTLRRCRGAAVAVGVGEEMFRDSQVPHTCRPDRDLPLERQFRHDILDEIRNNRHIFQQPVFVATRVRARWVRVASLYGRQPNLHLNSTRCLLATTKAPSTKPFKTFNHSSVLSFNSLILIQFLILICQTFFKSPQKVWFGNHIFPHLNGLTKYVCTCSFPEAKRVKSVCNFPSACCICQYVITHAKHLFHNNIFLPCILLQAFGKNSLKDRPTTLTYKLK